MLSSNWCYWVFLSTPGNLVVVSTDILDNIWCITCATNEEEAEVFNPLMSSTPNQVDMVGQRGRAEVTFLEVELSCRFAWSFLKAVVLQSEYKNYCVMDTMMIDELMIKKIRNFTVHGLLVLGAEIWVLFYSNFYWAWLFWLN